MKRDMPAGKTTIALLVLIMGFAASCENKTEFIPKSDILNMPTTTGRDIETVFTDSGKVNLILRTPLLEQFDSDKDNAYTEFKAGINVVFYDRKPNPVGLVTAKYAKYTQKDVLWELRDSVVVINETSMDKLETELLFWNQKTDLIYTDRFVKITSPDQVIQGFGFESDSHLQNRKIKKVNAIIYLPEGE